MAKKRKIIREIDKSRFKEIKDEETEEAKGEAREEDLEQEVQEQETQGFTEFFSRGESAVSVLEPTEAAQTSEALEDTATTASPAGTTTTSRAIDMDYTTNKYVEREYGPSAYEVTEEDIKASQPREARRLLTTGEIMESGPQRIQRFESEEMAQLRQTMERGSMEETLVKAEPLERKYEGGLPFQTKTKRRIL